ncbi:MAG: tRNA (adenosine(37)-N6)-threonylcarbamoyltransferase complex ATPase subunit type 1 TsaE [Chloroflexi bacterium]|nr:tRNA (adenosine(37)-N6)-threonylcarbamoyltransferase complex ATPase subunit type 1 TsaE [Chloroflexota bacterium]
MAHSTVTTHSPEQTRRLGRFIGGLAQGNDLYLLKGNLGTGKTHLVQGIAFGLGIREYACSPSFMIAREYRGRLALYHLDLYRLDHIEEITDLGLDEYFRADAVCAIEWAEKGSGVLPQDNLTIELEHLPGDVREITFLPHGIRYDNLAKAILNALAQDREMTWKLA